MHRPEKYTLFSFAGIVPKEIKKWLKTAMQCNAYIPLLLVEDAPAQYYIRYDVGKLYITTLGSEVPLFLPLVVDDLITTGIFLQQLVLVKQWVYVQELYNPASSISKEQYTIKLYRALKPDATDDKQFCNHRKPVAH
jgi:hypothetical protein